MGNLSCTKLKESKKPIAHLLRSHHSRAHQYSSVVIKSSTWVKDTHSLFDYENPSLVRKNIKTAGTCRLYLVGNDLVVRNDDMPPTKPYPEATIEKLATLSHHRGIYTLMEAVNDTAEQDNKIYNVIKYLKSEGWSGYKLKENDVIKFGRVKYVVKEIKCPSVPVSAMPLGTDNPPISDSSSEEASESHVPLSLPMPTGGETENDSCRICGGEENTSENPLLSACKCSGSIKFVHSECMKAWYKSKMAARTTRCADTYFIKGLECELCKTRLPLTIMNEGKSIDLVEIKRPENVPYLVLESTENSLNYKYVHIVHIEQPTAVARIGRNHECDIKINDNTVSRSHAFLRCIAGEFYLEDGNAKFGTLVQIREPTKLAPHVPYCVQIGRTVLTILVRNPNEKPVDFLRKEKAEDRRTKVPAGEINNRKIMEAELLAGEVGMLDSALNEAHPAEFIHQTYNSDPHFM